jgi:hypothetical protein
VIDIGSLRPGDRAAWEVLARGYKAFYRERFAGFIRYGYPLEHGRRRP